MAKAKEIEGLDCGGDASRNIDLILRTRLAEMCDLKDKALDWTDIEGVHDMRVASRRLRSLLRDFAPYFNERKAPRKQLREIARALGRVRDEDVAILALKKLRHKVDERAAAGIKEFIEERQRRREAARENLQLAINDEGITELQEKFREWLESAAILREKSAKEGSPGLLTFKEMGREVIQSQYAELDNLSRSLFNPFDVEPLHDMRIAAKRLRYSLELFCPCFGDELRAIAKEIAGLQSSLGELHDCDVWIDDLSKRLKARNRAAHSDINDSARGEQLTEEAADLWLLQHFVMERTKHYDDALSRWAEWKATGFYSKLNEHLQEAPEQQADPEEAAPQEPPQVSEPASEEEEINR
ncbi:MAG TPA: CHAD domain-containing protein [Pyrinomonadaceae bacterium]|jgi:CHAD domain-containing protein